ncbi:MAG TPA: choice-of-anchor B family protein [Candidatus Eisenbacteria bacterium]|nr:choice-of-anchor B family protein [Candidatus Eisenbacteria bacterium]
MRIPRGPALALPLLLAAAAGNAQPVTRNMQLLAHADDYHTPAVGQPYAYSACWAYVAGDGREYAVLGTSGGTAIYNVTAPESPYLVGFVPGPPSIWREMKQYRSWIYVESEGLGTGRGLQVIRMTDPEHPVLATTYTSADFMSAHTVTIDTTRAILVCNGSRLDEGGGIVPYEGMRVFSLANPEAPVEIGVWPPGGPYDGSNYVHDAVFAGTRLYVANIYAGTERVLDTTDPAHPVEIAGWSYPSAYYTHNSWPDSSGHYLYVTDEQNGQTLRVFDIHDLANPVLVNGISANPIAIVHNAHVRGHELYLSNYTEGIRVLDLADPAHPAEFGWADSYPGSSGGFGGVWEVCPFFPSGTVIASDMETGLYVYRPVRDYGLLRVNVQDPSGQPLAGVRVRLTTQGDSLWTPGDGVVMFAPSPGSHSVTADLFGWHPASISRTVVSGGRDTVTLTLSPRALTSFTGTIRDPNGVPLAGGEVDLAYTPLAAATDSTGAFRIDGVPDDDYHVSVRRPGFIPISFDRHIGIADPDGDFHLIPAAAWDPLEAETGWTVGAPGDGAIAGTWVRVAPVGTGTDPGAPAPAAPAARLSDPASPDRLLPQGTSPLTAIAAQWLGLTSACGDPARAALGAACPGTARVTAAGAGATGIEPPDGGQCGCGANCPCGVMTVSSAGGPIAPWSDRTPGSGSQCFVTGQAASHTANPDDSDLDGGRTTLTSPAFDMTGMHDPVIGWWRWFYSRDAGTGQPQEEDWLAVSVSGDDGLTWTAVDTTRGVDAAWEEQAVHVKQWVTPSTHVRIRFQAADLGLNSTVVAGVDDITAYDGALALLNVPPGAAGALRFRAPWPNPSAGAMHMALELPRAGDLSVEVLDVSGRRVRTLHRGPATAGTLDLTWDGRDARGDAASPGLYFAEARAGGGRARVRLVRVP